MHISPAVAQAKLQAGFIAHRVNARACRCSACSNTLKSHTSRCASCRPLTLNNEVDVGDAWLVVGLKGARVGPLVGYLHLVDVDGEVAVVAVGQRDALVQRPLVRPREQDVGAVEPGLVGHLLVNPTSAQGTGSCAQVKRKKKEKRGGCGAFHARLVFLHRRDIYR